jgi:hypothetical protein
MSTCYRTVPSLHFADIAAPEVTRRLGIQIVVNDAVNGLYGIRRGQNTLSMIVNGHGYCEFTSSESHGGSAVIAIIGQGLGVMFCAEGTDRFEEAAPEGGSSFFAIAAE